MKIAIFSDFFHPELGGIQDSIETLARGLAARGHHIEFHVPRYSAKDYKRSTLAVGERDLGAGVSVRRRFSLPFGGATHQSRMAVPSPLRLWRHKAQRPDIVHTQSFFGMGLEALLAARVWGVPLVGTSHFAREVFATYLPPFALKILTRYIKWYYAHCDFFSAPAHFIFEELAPLSVQHAVVTNAVDLSIFAPVSPAQKQEAKKQLKLVGPVIAYGGKLVKEKKIDVLIEALPAIRRQVPGVVFALAGHGEKEAELRAQVKRLGLDGAVHFLGTLDKPSMGKLFAAADVFVAMSTSEVQSISQLQAMAAGLPIVAAHSPASRGHAHEESGILFVEAGDTSGLAHTVVHLLTDEPFRTKVAARATLVAQQYSAAAVALQWEKVYEEAIENHKNKP